MSGSQQLILGEGAGGGIANYIEDVFQTWLYTGTGTSSSQTITNGIDLSTKGGMVWCKARDTTADNWLVDTTRSSTWFPLRSNTTGSLFGDPMLLGVGTTGFTLNGSVLSGWNGNGITYASWTFRKQPKFFDVVTYTGNGTRGTTISHNLGSVPGCIIIKKTSATENWAVYHRSLGNTQSLALNLTNAAGASFWNDTTPTSTVFTVGNEGQVNDPGQTYVAYLFAHDAGGFGLTGTDNVISCGSFTTDGSGNATVNLGYEPQWVLWKSSSNSSSWNIADNMRGFTASGPGGRILNPNNANAEGSSSGQGINSTGFSLIGSNANWTWIYVAIRRGPMKTPTTGTSVYTGITRTGTSADATVTGAGFPPDLALIKQRGTTGNASVWNDKLRGPNRELYSNNTDAEFAGSGGLNSFDQNGVSLGDNTGNMNDSGKTYINWLLRRAPGFFDEVCYTGTGSNLTLNHNLGIAPELIITKRRNGATYGAVYASSLGVDQYLELFSSSTGGRSAAQTFSGSWLTPTSTTFGVGVTDQNLSAATYVAYLFSTVAGVSKVGSYTGNGSSQTINCGFTGGARFVLIKRTNAAGDWVVFDSARGIVSGNDPFLELNTTAAEQTGQDAVDTDSTGFVVNETTENLNVNGASYIFLAIA
jgi:hypothetical protein